MLYCDITVGLAMHLAKLRTVGGSVMFAIPKAILESLNLAPEKQVGLPVSDGKLIVEPRPRVCYTLDDLMAQCDLSAPMTRSEEHTSELQSPVHLVCRLLLEKKKTQTLRKTAQMVLLPKQWKRRSSPCFSGFFSKTNSQCFKRRCMHSTMRLCCL